MDTVSGAQINLATILNPAAHYLRRPFRLIRSYERSNLQPDLIAGLTVAVILLPQAIAFALIAELPPEMGIYTAVMGAIFGALWGSSNQVHTGPTNAISLLVLSSLQGANLQDSNQLFVAAGLLAFMAGAFQLIMGLARLGILINFVSHSVVVGFATGAGVLIAIKQVNPLLGIRFESENLLETFAGIATHLTGTHLFTAALGISTMLLIIILRKVNPKIPGPLSGMVVASILVFIGGLNEQGVETIGQLPSSFPPLADLPSFFDVDLLGQLSVGALAVGAIGLVETTAIARSVSTQTGQRLSSNQEFVGQGLANIAAGIFSGYPSAGSFSRTAVNFRAGAKTPVAALFSSGFVLIALFALGPLAAFLPRSALAGVLIITAYGMIDRAEIVRIWQGTRGDAAIMLVTFLGTLFLHIEFAVLTGILFSLARYIMRTSTPRVHDVLPDTLHKHFTYQPDRLPCPQLGVIDILGDLYFGAVNHVEEAILALAAKRTEQRFLLIRMHSVNHCDFSGIHMLESVVKTYRDRGGDVYIVRAGYAVRKVMASTGFDQYLEEDHFLSEEESISFLFHKMLDPAVCIYECPLRIFKECQNLPKRDTAGLLPHHWDGADVGLEVEDIKPMQLWQQMHNVEKTRRPFVVDVREPREFRRGHIPEAQLVPLPYILQDRIKLPADRPLVLTCRSGRRSRRAAHALQESGFQNVMVLDGGMLAWEAAELLLAVE